MNGKLVIFTVTATVLLQCCTALASANEVSSEENDKISKNKTEEFIDNNEKKFADWVELTMSKPEGIFSKVFEDVYGLDLEKEPLHSYIKDMHDYVEVMNKFREYRLKNDTTREENIAKLREIYEHLDNVWQKHNTDTMENPTIDDFIIELSLSKNGMNKFKQGAKKFWKELNDEMDRYIKSISEEDKGKEERLLNWYSEHKKQEKLPDKMMHYISLYRMYNDMSN